MVYVGLWYVWNGIYRAMYGIELCMGYRVLYV